VRQSRAWGFQRNYLLETLNWIGQVQVTAVVLQRQRLLTSMHVHGVRLGRHSSAAAGKVKT
jgi:hypothetical protein